jgi:antitoxin component YwqK of YwqJK toxin-antitoxin module
VRDEGFYTNGLESGLWKFFDEGGNPTYEGHYEQGQRVGQWYFYNKSGKRKKWRNFH